MAKIETLVDPFDDRNNWVPLPPPYDVYDTGSSVLTGVLNHDYSLDTSFAAFWSVNEYEVQNSWWSVTLTDVSEGYDSYTLAQFNGISTDLSSVSFGFAVYYGADVTVSPTVIDPTKITLYCQGGKALLNTSDAPITLGFRMDTYAACAAFYSLDGGSTWTQVGHSYSADPITTDSYHFLWQFLAQGSTATSDTVVKFDNFNSVAPPSVPPPPDPFVDVSPATLYLTTNEVITPVSMSDLKDTFNNLSNFIVSAYGVTITADGTLNVACTAHGSPSLAYLKSRVLVDPVDSWTSIRILNIGQAPNGYNGTGGVSAQIALQDDTSNINYTFYVYGNTTGNLTAYTAMTDFSSSTSGFNHFIGNINVNSIQVLTLAMRVSDGNLYFYFSLNDGISWTLADTVPYVAPGGAQFLRYYLSGGSVGETDFTLQFDDLGLLEPPTPGKTSVMPATIALQGYPVSTVDPNIVTVSLVSKALVGYTVNTADPNLVTVSPAIIALVGQSLGTVTGTKLHILQDSFPDLSKWNIVNSFDGSITANGTLNLKHNAGSSFSYLSLKTKDLAEAQDSWTSIRFLNIGDIPVSTSNNAISYRIYDPTGAKLWGFYMQFNNSTHSLSIKWQNQSSASSATNVTINSGTVLTLAMRLASGGIEFYYSVNDGTTWNKMTTQNYTGLNSQFEAYVQIDSQINNTSSDFILQVDDLSQLEPPNPTTVSIAAISKAFTGIAIDGVIKGAFSLPIDPATRSLSGVAIDGIIFGPPCQQVTPA